MHTAHRNVRIVLPVLALLALLLTSTSAHAGIAFATRSFDQLWSQADKLLAESGQAGRSWTWGPYGFVLRNEPYKEGDHGQRTVEYFDKSRMETFDGQPWAAGGIPRPVTNGLLVKELVTGKLQLGDNTFDQRSPAQEAVAGDPASVNANAPTYASFGTVISFTPGQNAAQQQTGTTIKTALDKNGTVSTLTNPPAIVTYAAYDNVFRHNIAAPFNAFMFARGRIWDGKQYVDGQIYTDDPIHKVFGLPVSEAFWTRARVGGVEKDVLVQMFERRVLTYTPSNSDPYKVEMGNVGRHYYAWRYGSSNSAPILRGTVAFVENCALHLANADGTNARTVYSPASPNCVSSRSIALSRDGRRVAFTTDSRGGSDMLYLVNSDGTGLQSIAPTDGGRYYRAVNWSPDGRHVAFANTNTSRIFLVDVSDLSQNRLDDYAPAPPTSVFAWTPDGQSVIYQTGSPDTGVALYVAKAGVKGAGAVKVAGDNYIWSFNNNYEVLAVSPDNTSIVVTGGSAFTILSLPGKSSPYDKRSYLVAAPPVGWSADGQYIICDGGATLALKLSDEVEYYLSGAPVSGWAAQ